MDKFKEYNEGIKQRKEFEDIMMNKIIEKPHCFKGMVLNEQQRKEFEDASRFLMEWLSKNCHPYVKVIVDYSRSEILEGINNFMTEDYIIARRKLWATGVVEIIKKK